MRGVIYVDILFFVNALIGYFLLRGAALLAGRIAADWRIFLGAAAAGLSSLLLLLPPLPQWLMWGAKIGSAVLIVFASFPVHNVRGFLKCCFWYVFLNIALSGAVFAATYYGAAQNVSTNNLSVYFNVSPLLLIGCIAGVYLAVQLCAWAFGRPQQVRTIPFTARFEDGCVQGLVDTGFSVRDPITGTPAFLLSFPAVRGALPPGLLRALALYFDDGAMETGGMPLRLIPTKTAAGTRALPAVNWGWRQTARPAAIRAYVRCSRRSLWRTAASAPSYPRREELAEPDAAAGRTKTQLSAAQGAAPPADHTKEKKNVR